MTVPVPALAPLSRPVLIRLVPPLPADGPAQPELPFREPRPDLWPAQPSRTAEERVVRAIAVALVEVLAGRRPPSQAHPIVAEEVGSVVGHVLRSRVAHGLVVASFRMQEPRPGVAEVTLRLADAHRNAALALRLEGRRTRWRCTALEGSLVEGATRPFRSHS
ncbi:Rv3235 family protein [Propioniciclava soli]|uniref:Rv3235 family protein n=1 Tax=Propioniciclava soli TaxID=2775081 RepID=A0ABZ3CCJ4_9ACTN|nr:Rv3235 family protein [Propioniciclava soli]